MTTKEFYQSYDLKEAEIISIKQEQDSLIFIVTFPVYLEYMANGFRCDFDLNYRYLITFNHVSPNLKEASSYSINNYELVDDKLIFTLNKINYIVNGNISIKKMKEH